MTTHTTHQLAAEIRAEIEREPGQHFDGPIRGDALEVLEAGVRVAVRRETQRKAPVADDATVARVAHAIAVSVGHERDEDIDEETGDLVPGCADCAEPGWPCDMAIDAAKAAIAALTEEV